MPCERSRRCKLGPASEDPPPLALVVTALAIILLALPSGATEWFGEPIVTQTQPNLYLIRTIDLNHDAQLDIVAASVEGENPWSFRVFLGDGLGNWAPSDTMTMVEVGGSSPFALLDENLDGHTDIIGYNRSAGRLTVWRNDGEGRFSASGNYLGGQGPFAVADLDADGYVDLVSSMLEGLWIRFGGPGGLLWDPGRMYYVEGGGNYPLTEDHAALIIDLNGDNHLDIVVAGMAKTVEWGDGPAVIRWRLGNGTRTFADTRTFLAGSVESSIRSCSASDLDQDGDLDLACSSYDVDDALFFYDAQADRFVPGGDPFQGGVWNRGPILLGDLDGDSLDDAVVCRIQEGGVILGRAYRGFGNGTFSFVQDLPGVGAGELAPVLGAQQLDLVSASSFPPTDKPLAVWPNLETVSDVEGDGTLMARAIMHAHPAIAASSTRLSLSSMPRATVVTEIFDIRGARVRALTLGADGATWDLADADGHPVPSGVYWARAMGLPAVRSARIVVAR